ncbi:MAG: hypothetical protein M3Q45_01710, partial [Chloroflexota bacterium]|nr:hypothetical protein [Chloroflexota bacterium]
TESSSAAITESEAMITAEMVQSSAIVSDVVATRITDTMLATAAQTSVSSATVGNATAKPLSPTQAFSPLSAANEADSATSARTTPAFQSLLRILQLASALAALLLGALWWRTRPVRQEI